MIYIHIIFSSFFITTIIIIISELIILFLGLKNIWTLIWENCVFFSEISFRFQFQSFFVLHYSPKMPIFSLLFLFFFFFYYSYHFLFEIKLYLLIRLRHWLNQRRFWRKLTDYQQNHCSASYLFNNDKN